MKRSRLARARQVADREMMASRDNRIRSTRFTVFFVWQAGGYGTEDLGSNQYKGKYSMAFGGY
jgi:hypothetical protein